jgi:hypothetical protein
MVDTAKKAILCKQVAIAVFLDIKGAFDNLSSEAEAIEDGLNGHKVGNDLTEWFCSYLNSRYCRVKGSKQYFKLVKGMGQGGVLSPTVWNYVMDSFLSTFSNHKVDAYSYADDGALIVVSRDIVTARRHMQDAVTRAQIWATGLGLEFSMSKTKVMIFSRQRDPPTLTCPIIMNGAHLEVVDQFKYLGITLDSKLRWIPHITNKSQKAIKHLMLLHKGLGTTWGPSPAITIWLCTGIVRPALTYEAATWSRAAATKAMAAKLKEIQRLGMIMIAPIRRNTPMSGLEIALGVPPLDLHIQYLASSTYNRLNLTPNGRTGQATEKTHDQTKKKACSVTLTDQVEKEDLAQA